MRHDTYIEGAMVVGLTVLGCAVCVVIGLAIGQWPSIDTTSRPAVITGGCTIVAAVGAALVVLWQLRRQAENTRNANRESEKMKLKKEIYDKISPTVDVASDSQVKLLWSLQRFLMDIDHFRKLPSWRVQANSDELIALFEKCHAGGNAIVREAQRWEIADPRVEIFRTAFSSALFDLIEANTSYVNFAFRFMPNSPADPQRVTATVPSVDEWHTLAGLTVALGHAIHDLMYFTRDFQIEMQNHLLGELFGHQVRERRPNENEPKVVRLRDHIELQKYFETDTAWGKDQAKGRATMSGSL